ncbi:sulfatase-like hydrolase/transferase [Blastopirellula marina]|uniref:sulfatase-like hydrolase/transferase n=1 Tax=Blastopirellula marina TaxID=124 RepID=UPI001E2D4309|nr:sulfatase-like hydrolase/transferase [Blastopirellula marina]
MRIARNYSALLALLLLGVIAQIGKSEQPNLIFILTDDQRYDTLGCTGNQFIETPNLDQLAADGILFANASVTSAICTPSRACYFLGQYERKHGVNFNSGTAMSPTAWAKSYPVLLREAGYYTGYVGKNHVPIGPKGYGSKVMEPSFDFWYAGHGHLTFYPKGPHAIFKHAKADTQIEVVAEGAASFLNAEEDYVEGAAAFLDRRPKDKPFCLSIALNLPHAAGTRTMKMLPSDPELYRTKYRDKLDQISLPKTYVAKEQIASPRLPADVLHAQYRQSSYDYVDTPESLKEQLIRKAQTITGIDRMVGEIRETLAAQGLDQNTVILFSSDHGIMQGEFGLGGKALNYEACLRIPMIIMDPRVDRQNQGRRSMALVESVDIAPTMLDLAGVDRPDSMQGCSLKEMIAGRSESVRDSSFAENLWSTYFGNPRIESVRTAEWKYIRYFKNDRELFADVTGKTQYRVTPVHAKSYADWLTSSIEGELPVYEELFHLPSDPSESVNLAQRTAYSNALEQMRAECQRLVTFAKGDRSRPPETVPLR